MPFCSKEITDLQGSAMTSEFRVILSDIQLFLDPLTNWQLTTQTLITKTYNARLTRMLLLHI